MRTYKNENDVKRHVKELLDKHGWFHWANSAGSFSTGGLEDRSAIRNGVYLGIECKFGSRPQTALQRKRELDLNDAGGTYLLVNEKCMDSLEEILRTAK